MLPNRALIGLGALHKLGLKVDFTNYMIYELEDDAKLEDI
jgi:hypothetical protein